MVGKYFAPIEPTPQILTAARNQNRYRKKTKSFGPESPKLSPSEKSRSDYRVFFLSRLAAFFSAAVLSGAFLVCFLEFWDLAIGHRADVYGLKRGPMPATPTLFLI